MSTSAAGSTLPNLSNALSSQAGSKSAESAAASESSASANAPSSTSATTTASKTSVVITGSGSAGATTGSIPVITGGSTATDGGGLPKGLPTLSGAFSIVAPSVPPTADAPFMRTSSLPEGTVFIVVGAILGFLAMSVLLWRGLVAWSLHRSVKRAALLQNTSDTKSLFRTPPVPFYSYKDRESTLSLGNMGHRNRKSARPTTASGAAASQSSLFFSPTAGAASANAHTPGNRGSNYLPAGYYAAGASQPGNGQGMAHIGHGPAISLSNLGPQRGGYARASSVGPSPPGSPGFHGHNASSSSLALDRVPGDQRAPSVFLDNLFDSEGGPPVPVSGHQHGGSGSQSRY